MAVSGQSKQAQEALKILAAEGMDVAEGELDRRLPAYALRLEKSGKEVSVGFLLERVREKKVPPMPVLLAQEALEILEAEDGSVDENLKRQLPVFAIQLSRAGEDVTLALLLKRARANELEKEAAPKAEKKTYAEIVAGFPAIEDPEEAAILAASSGDIDKLKDIINRGLDMSSYFDLFGNLLLQCAADNGHLNMVEYLEEEKRIPLQGGPCILPAIERGGHLDVVKYIVEKEGFDEYDDQYLALIYAAKYGRLNALKYLVEYSGMGNEMRDDLLGLAARGGHLETVKYLTEELGANVHAGNDVALRDAASQGHLEVVRYLVEEKGANVHACNDNALRDAAEHGHPDIMKYLGEHGADTSVLDATHRENLKCYIAACETWQKVVHVDPPQGLDKEDIAYFKPKVFEAVRDMLRQEGYDGKEGNIMAFYAAGLFGTEERVFAVS